MAKIAKKFGILKILPSKDKEKSFYEKGKIFLGKYSNEEHKIAHYFYIINTFLFGDSANSINDSFLMAKEYGYIFSRSTKKWLKETVKKIKNK